MVSSPFELEVEAVLNLGDPLALLFLTLVSLGQAFSALSRGLVLYLLDTLVELPLFLLLFGWAKWLVVLRDQPAIFGAIEKSHIVGSRFR